MRKVAITLNILALIASSCGQNSTKKQTENDSVYQPESTELSDKTENIEQSYEIEFDMVFIPQFPENEEGYRSEIKTDIEILLPAGYREMNPADFKPMLSEKWYDFYQDSIAKKYLLKKADIEIGKFYDDCLQDSTTYVSSQQESLILVKGIIPQHEEISSIPVKKYHVWVGEKSEFSFNGKTYVFRGDGITIQEGMAWTDEDLPGRWDKVENYKLYLSEQGKEEQLIVAIPSFNDTFVQILWIGDLDEDGKPDFILDISRDYEEKAVLLFLSSKAEKGEIVRAVASSSYQFDC